MLIVDQGFFFKCNFEDWLKETNSLKNQRTKIGEIWADFLFYQQSDGRYQIQPFFQTTRKPNKI